MKTTMLSEHPDAKSPAGADIRYLMDGKTGNMVLCSGEMGADDLMLSDICYRQSRV